ncbi:Alpha/Beta hydrolase protein [Podospora didyma]|uniref:Alpha/Beta hydrolase protein n=1 Tax=Podospora didyma TaxID=330526 RepID=A0AAE0U8P7_9PEZI|nr:Alpha/Beta hydrolase protein [Podospora didyma]
MSSLESAIASLSASQPGKIPAAGPATDSLHHVADPKELLEEHILPKLDPVFLQYFVDVLSKQPPSHLVPLEETRNHPEKYRSPGALDTSSGYERVRDDVVSSQDGASIPVRVYHPDPMVHGPGPYPVHLNYHGGGFVLGDLWSDGQLCLSMREAGVVVIDVYSWLTPGESETIWGKCIQDAWASLNWARDSSSTLNVNPTSVSIGGISAGGHISLILQHMARDAGIELKLCLASVPSSMDAIWYTYYTDSPFSSFHEFHRAPVLPWTRIKYFGRFCTPKDKKHDIRQMWPDWWFAPIRAPNWSGLCETFIRTAEVDPLRDEGEAYGLKLVAGGTRVTLKRYLGCPHTFMHLPFMKQKVEYDQDAVAALRVAHGLQ